jgi:hypothetical protein
MCTASPRYALDSGDLCNRRKRAVRGGGAVARLIDRRVLVRGGIDE